MSHPTINIPRPSGADPDSLHDDPRLGFSESALTERASRIAASEVIRTAADAEHNRRMSKTPHKDDYRAEYRTEWALGSQTRGENDYNGYYDWIHPDDDNKPEADRKVRRESLEGTKIGITDPDTGELKHWGKVDFARVRELIHAEALRDNVAHNAEQARLAARHPARRALGRVAKATGMPKRFH